MSISLGKTALGLLVASGTMYTVDNIKTQREIFSTTWFQDALVRVEKHEGVHKLIGQPPLEFGRVIRYGSDRCEPLKEVTPPQIYVLEVSLKGTEGEGKIRMYLNFHVPIATVRKDMNAWNVGLLEVQVGDNRANRFIIR